MPDKNKNAVNHWAMEQELSIGGASDETEHVHSFIQKDTNLKLNDKGRGIRRKERRKTSRMTARTIFCISSLLQRILQKSEFFNFNINLFPRLVLELFASCFFSNFFKISVVSVVPFQRKLN